MRKGIAFYNSKEYTVGRSIYSYHEFPPQSFKHKQRVTRMTHEIHHRFMEQKIIKRGALIMGAALVGGLVETGRALHERRQPNVADVVSYYEDEGPAFFFFGGCGENNLAQAPLFHRKVGGYGSLHFEYQIQGRYSQELVDQSVIKAAKSEGERDWIFMGSSMGLMKAMRSLMNPAVRESIGEGRLQAVVSRQGITSRENLQPEMQRAAWISSKTPALPIVGDGWELQRLSKAHGEIAHSESTTDEEARIHNESSAYLPFPLVSSQHRAIHRSEPWAKGSHQVIVDENPDLRLFQITPEHDGVANWQSTNESLERAFGLPVETITDERRPRGSHANDLEFIEPLEELMMKLSGRDRHMAAAARNLIMYSSGLAHAA